MSLIKDQSLIKDTFDPPLSSDWSVAQQFWLDNRVLHGFKPSGVWHQGIVWDSRCRTASPITVGTKFCCCRAHSQTRFSTRPTMVISVPFQHSINRNNACWPKEDHRIDCTCIGMSCHCNLWMHKEIWLEQQEKIADRNRHPRRDEEDSNRTNLHFNCCWVQAWIGWSDEDEGD